MGRVLKGNILMAIIISTNFKFLIHKFRSFIANAAQKEKFWQTIIRVQF